MSYIVSLTTIPSRFSEIEETIASLLVSTMPPLKIIVNIPRSYRFRFHGASIPEEELRQFAERHSDDNVFLNLVEQDMGPGTKIAGLFQNGILPEGFLDASDNFVVLVDDDFSYKPYMLEWFNSYIADKPAVEAASFWVYDIGGVAVGQGADGFFLRAKSLHAFMPFFERLAQEDYLLYHDDFCVSFFYFLRGSPAHAMTPPYNSLIYNTLAKSERDSLFRIQGKYERNALNWKCLEILTRNSKELVEILAAAAR